MYPVTTSWNDEENNRRIEMRVDYAFRNGELVIGQVTPLAILFRETSGRVSRRVNIRTAKGRNLILQKVAESQGLAWLHEQAQESLSTRDQFAF